MILHNLTASELIRLIKKSEITPLDIVNQFIERIKMLEASIHAWEYFDPDAVLDYLHQLESKRKSVGNYKSLYGLPVGVKDVFNTSAFPTTMGSEIWQGFTPGNDSRVVYDIIQNDGIIFGKTVTAEFAVHYLGSDKTKNPHNPLHTPGTSSSGSAAAVAAHMVPLSIGTQTAGSIIRPASFCGVYGFKPTFGTVPRTGVLKTTDTLDTIGGFANSIEDIELLFSIIHVKGKDYPIVHNKLIKREITNKPTIGIVIDDLHIFKKYPSYALDLFEKAVSKLSSSNKFAVKKYMIVDEMNDIHYHHKNIYDKTLSYYFSNEYKTSKKQISQVMIQAIKNGEEISIEQYLSSMEAQKRISKRFDDSFKDYDVLVTLSTAGEAPLLGKTELDDTCLIWTFLGLPVLNMPLFIGPGKLPFGLQVVGRKYDDYTMLHIARDIENAIKI